MNNMPNVNMNPRPNNAYIEYGRAVTLPEGNYAFTEDEVVNSLLLADQFGEDYSPNDELEVKELVHQLFDALEEKNKMDSDPSPEEMNKMIISSGLHSPNSYQTEINKLADFILAEMPGEPSQNESVVDCAIRLLMQYKQHSLELFEQLSLEKLNTKDADNEVQKLNSKVEKASETLGVMDDHIERVTPTHTRELIPSQSPMVVHNHFHAPLTDQDNRKSLYTSEVTKAVDKFHQMTGNLSYADPQSFTGGVMAKV